MNPVTWVKQNKFTALLLVVLFYFGYQYLASSMVGMSIRNTSYDSAQSGSFGMASPSLESTFDKVGAPAAISRESSSILPPFEPDYAPQAGVDNRLVVQESYLSLLVKDVTDTRNKIVDYARQNGGYMVNSNTNNPEEAPTATVIVRVPASKLEDALSTYRTVGVKVVNENLVGTDVTDQYVDIETRIEQLEKTKAKLEELLDRATLISDITNLTQQILSYQSQIDSYIGQQEALKKNADLAKLTIYLSTDEIALPYSPTETWRPGVIFKLAVRSLVSSLRDLGEFVIWAGVYSVIWVPALLIFWYVRRRMNKSKKVESASYKN